MAEVRSIDDNMHSTTQLDMDISIINTQEVLTVTPAMEYKQNTFDKVFMTSYLLLMLCFGTMLNGIIIYLTNKYYQFHAPYMYVKSACALLDILLAWGLVPHTIINDHLDEKMIPSQLMCFRSDFGLGVFYATAHFTAIVALERYLFFCKPFLYQRFVTLKSIIGATIFILLFAQLYIFSTEIIYVRELQPLVALCQLRKQTYHNAIQFGMFFLPPIIVTTFSIQSIKRLINKVDIAVESSHVTNLEPILRKRSAARGLR